MIGLAVGDALGLPTLFMTAVEVRRRLGPRGIREFVGSEYHPAGSVSDDTQTALAIARAILETRELGIDALGVATAAELVRWCRGANLDRGPDATVMRSVNRLEEGLPWRGSGDPGSRSAGALARAVPLGIVFALRPERIPDMSQAACTPTHAHPVAVASFIAAATLVSCAVSGYPEARWGVALSRAIGSLAPEVCDRVTLALRRRRSRPGAALAELGEGWMADEVVARSAYFAFHHEDDFEGAVLMAANSSGDTAATAALTGAFAGARLGLKAVPRKLRENVEGGADVRRIALELAGAASA